MVSKSARRYAGALLQTAIEEKTLEVVLADMHLLKNTLHGSRDLLLFLRSPVVKTEVKDSVLTSVFEGKVSDLTARFLKLVAEKRRENLLDQIATSFLDLYNVHAGIIEIDVQTAFSLTDDQQSDLKASLEKTTEKKVLLDVQVVPELIGGLSVRIDDTVIDGTIKHQMRRLKSLFTESVIEKT
jgi:F-type H+-transporting ATPase subunit delta